MSFFRFYRCLFALVVASLGIVPTLGPWVQEAEAAPTPGCISNWYVSYSGIGSWTLVHTDPEGLPLSDLRFSRSYNDPTDKSKGYLDFDGDGKSDIFSAVPIGGGDYRWRYSSGATSDWIDLAYDSTPPDQLRFGDFNGDGFTDVFSTLDLGNGFLQWRASLSGTNSYDTFPGMAFDSTPLDQLRFGDFNADGKTDVFTLQDLGLGQMGWNVSYSGTTSYHRIFTDTIGIPLSEMQLGDVDDDGHTDVFTTISNTLQQKWEWFYSSAGTGAYQSIVLNELSVHDVIAAGNFDPIPVTDDGFGGTDLFYTMPRTGDPGFYDWWYFHYNKNLPHVMGDVPLAYDSTPPDQLRFGDFNGDGVTDVFKLVQHCTVFLPLVKR